MYLGQSSQAQDYILIDNAGTDKIITVTAEQHTLNELYTETLSNRGVDVTSIQVKNANGVEFNSPLTSSSPDYVVETENNLTTIKRTTASKITSGLTVLVNYQYLENIVITYKTNLVVSNLQLEVDVQKHMGADVLVKEVSPVYISIKGLVYLSTGINPTIVDSAIRASLQNLILSNPLGGEIYPSDVIREIDTVKGVSYVSVPLTQLSLTKEDQILREQINPTAPTELSDLTNSSHKVWLIDTEIKHIPDTGGGSSARVFLDKTEISVLTEGQRKTPSNWLGVKGSIVGLEKAFVIINGVPNEIPNSTRKLMVSLPFGKTPLDYKIEINYTCGDNTNVVGEIKINKFSYFQMGELSFTYEESR
jgi:hypothetical protein